jgi:nickel-dependent lactate racemase
MEVELIYGKGRLALEMPPNAAVDVFEPAQSVTAVDIDTFRRAFTGASGPSRLDGRLLLIVNDGYRPTPTPTVLDWLDRVDGNLLDRADFLLATGSHQAPTDEHLEKIFGRHFLRVSRRVFWHAADDSRNLAAVGADRFGAEVFVNRRFLDYERVCVISSVEPHYFAGYTGGRKSIFPGLADLDTIERNHNLANSLEARPQRLVGNPVAEHLDELMALVDNEKIFAIQLVLDAAGKPAGVFAGDLKEAFAAAVERARDIFSHDVGQPYDAVVAELRTPLDANLYQVQKALENCQAAVVDGGEVVVMAACAEGIGSPHFFELAGRWDRKTNQPSSGAVSFGSHKLSRVIAHGCRIGVGLFSELPDDVVRRVFYEPISDVGSFLKGRAGNRRDYQVAVVRDAGHTVLELNAKPLQRYFQ